MDTDDPCAVHAAAASALCRSLSVYSYAASFSHVANGFRDEYVDHALAASILCRVLSLQLFVLYMMC
jgi:hypothetical protein